MQQAAVIRMILEPIFSRALLRAAPLSLPTSSIHYFSSSSEENQGATPASSNPSINGMLSQRLKLGSSPTAGFSSSTEVATSGEENSWSKFRAPYGFEQKSSLGPAMYLSIGVFGFSMYLNDMIYHPPRVVTMLGLMMLLLYVRRH